MSLEIRKMEERDAGEVFRMMRSFYDSPAVFTTAPDEILNRDIADCLREDMPFLEGFVFEWEGQLAGYAMTSPNYTTEYGGICIWVEDLYIQPAFRRKGIGRAFFAFMKEQYPEAVRFKLEVEKENEGAIATYLNSGFGISPYFEMTRELRGEKDFSGQ